MLCSKCGRYTLSRLNSFFVPLTKQLNRFRIQPLLEANLWLRWPTCNPLLLPCNFSLRNRNASAISLNELLNRLPSRKNFLILRFVEHSSCLLHLRSPKERPCRDVEARRCCQPLHRLWIVVLAVLEQLLRGNSPLLRLLVILLCHRHHWSETGSHRFRERFTRISGSLDESCACVTLFWRPRYLNRRPLSRLLVFLDRFGDPPIVLLANSLFLRLKLSHLLLSQYRPQHLLDRPSDVRWPQRPTFIECLGLRLHALRHQRLGDRALPLQYRLLRSNVVGQGLGLAQQRITAVSSHSRLSRR